MIYTTPDDYYQALGNLILQKPDMVLIGTFGIYAGIGPRGEDTAKYGSKYMSKTRIILDALKKTKCVKILVGVTDFRSCQDDIHCKHCENKFILAACRLIEHAEFWSNYEWRFCNNFHLKSFLACYNDEVIGIGGGRNFSNSEWLDISFDLDNSQAIETLKLWSQAWKTADEINNANIEQYLNRSIV